MGNWNINIQGVGQHHNSTAAEAVQAKDANRMAAEFVKKLTAAGHFVDNATFTYGSKEDLNPK